MIGVSLIDVQQEGNVVTVYLDTVDHEQRPLFSSGEEMYATLTDADGIIKGHLIVVVNIL